MPGSQPLKIAGLEKNNQTDNNPAGYGQMKRKLEIPSPIRGNHKERIIN